ILFTIKTIQNSDYKSPLRANWIDVDAEKISDKSLSFTLKQPYNSFLENCTLKIIPQHIWENISPENFILSSYNLQPVGSGPFTFADLKQTNTGFITALNLQSNRQYYNKPSFVAGLSFKFYGKTDDAIKAASAKEIDGFSLATQSENDSTGQKSGFLAHSFSLPRYFAVFFNNQKPNIFSDASLRQALTYGVNKSELIQQITSKASATQSGETGITQVDSPILPDFYGFDEPTNVLTFNPDTAKTLLDKAGFKLNTEGQRVKAIAKKPAFQFKSYLKVGSKGSEVIQLQGCLSRLSDTFKTLLANETNGTYGKGTENAVMQFQQTYLPGSKPTGETGSATRQKLNLLCITPAPDTQP
ncbi:MAG: ABC transporter substrate-binding protein, partial [Candidatus Paceibacterales bacterium]